MQEEEEEVSAANPFPGVEARPRFEDREGASSAPIFRRGGCPPTLNSWLQRPGGAVVAVTAADAVNAAAAPFVRGGEFSSYSSRNIVIKLLLLL